MAEKAYGSIADARRLLRRERDPLTGRVGRLRDEKGRHRPERPRLRPPRTIVGAGAVAAGAVAVVAVAVGASAALSGGDGRSERGSEEAVDTAQPGSGEGDGGSATDDASATDGSPSTSVGAITLLYSGGAFERQECVDLLATGACDVEFSELDEPLSVRCTVDACELALNGQTFSLDGPVSTSQTVPHFPGCGTQDWTLDLAPVGTSVTRGIEHPARLQGRLTGHAPASLPPGQNCLGRDEVYVIDAVPQ